MTTDTPWCIAHRGARDEAPENTMTAFKQALAYPVDGIEFDVQLSADGIAVLFHDRTLQKVGGGDKKVSELTVDELDRFDWGRWFHPNFSNEALPTLDAALQFLPRCPRMLVEIKTQSADHENGHARRLTETVIQMLTRADLKPFEDRIMVLSFDGKVLAMAHEMAPHLKYVLNMPETDPAAALDDVRHLHAADVKIDNLTDDLARRVRDLNLKLFTYTCNTPQQVDKAREIGVDAIITDRPMWLTWYLRQE